MKKYVPPRRRFVIGRKSASIDSPKAEKNDKKRWFQFHHCWCCYAFILLLLLLLGLLFSYFMEAILSQLYSRIYVPFGQQNFNITVPVDKRHITLCVRDFGCEDGDKVEVSVNSNVIFSGEIYSVAICKNEIKVNEGDNVIELYAINGTGGKGNCPNNINTGEVTIHGKNVESQSWHQLAQEKETATLKIKIDNN